VASEDATFWTKRGASTSKALLRASVEQLHGREHTGRVDRSRSSTRASPFDLKGATYNRKLREAVLAWKMSDDLSKADILESYLNSVPFGRQARGAEAAAKAYFGKTVNKDAPPEQQITKSEAMALVAHG
jgi:membrane peptidoglycan carboxypeptidase